MSDNRTARRQKLVSWDADFYKSLSDEDCIVCLTEKQVYLLGQTLEQLRWYNTRWTGDKSGLDFDEIASILEWRLEERMTCDNLTRILDRLDAIELKIDDIQNPSPDFDPNSTTINDEWTDEELSSLGYDSATCTDTDKDKLYGAIDQLVRYMHQLNVDFFEELAQIGNFTDQIDRLKETTGAMNIIPFANAFDFATFYINELLDEYNATVDEALLQQTICDLFCIAVNSGCHFNFYDVFDYFSAKVEPTFSNATTTFLDLVQFALSGTFTGSEYYWFATYFQLAMAGLSQQYLGLTALDPYITQFYAGLNSPDNDWTLFCDDCPTQYRLFRWDFSKGLGHFEIDDFFGAGNLGVYQNGRIEGTGTNDIKTLSIAWNDFDPTWRVMSVKLNLERVNGVTGQGNNDSAVQMRPTPDSTVGMTQILGGQNDVDGEFIRCEDLTFAPYFDAANQLYIFSRITKTSASPEVQVYLTAIELLFTADRAPADTRIVEDNTIC